MTFAGSVAGARHVTVLHPDGLRTTASYLATIAVVVGQEVAQGDLLGTTEGRLHFGARSGDAYLDPASLFVEGPPQVWLVPFDRPPGLGLAGERSAIRQLLGVGSGVLHLAGRVVEQGDELLRMAAHHTPLGVQPLQVVGLVVALRRGRRGRVGGVPPALHRGWRELAPPAERRAAVLVGGLGSTSEHASVDDVDVAALGYDAADVVRFSYAGGRTPRSTGHPAGVPSRRYSAADSQQDLHESGRRLADLVEQVAGTHPGTPVDVIAHSQGGIVARLALVELQRRGSAGTVGLLATLGTPHGGADLATAARAAGFVPGGSGLLDAAAGAAGSGIDPSSPSVAQLSETSDLIVELGRTPLPEGLAAVSIAARTDPIVPVPRTRLEGATSVVVPTASAGAHSDLPGDPRTTRELALALAGAAAGCRDVVGGGAGPGRGPGDRHLGGVAPSPLASILGLGTPRSHHTPCTRAIPRSSSPPGPGARPGADIRRHSEPREGSHSWPSSP